MICLLASLSIAHECALIKGVLRFHNLLISFAGVSAGWASAEVNGCSTRALWEDYGERVRPATILHGSVASMSCKVDPAYGHSFRFCHDRGTVSEQHRLGYHSWMLCVCWVRAAEPTIRCWLIRTVIACGSFFCPGLTVLLCRTWMGMMVYCPLSVSSVGTGVTGSSQGFLQVAQDSVESDLLMSCEICVATPPVLMYPDIMC